MLSELAAMAGFGQIFYLEGEMLMQLREVRTTTWFTESRLWKQSIGVFFAFSLAIDTPCTAQSPKAPVPHLSQSAPTVTGDANFGRCLGMGKFGDATDSEDDLVICATNERVQNSLGQWIIGTGAAYPFQNSSLSLGPAQRIVPPTFQVDQSVVEKLGFGMLDVAIGNVRGANFTNLVFIAAAHVDRATNLAGSVDVYDMTVGTPGTAVRVIDPPLDPVPIFGPVVMGLHGAVC